IGYVFATEHQLGDGPLAFHLLELRLAQQRPAADRSAYAVMTSIFRFGVWAWDHCWRPPTGDTHLAPERQRLFRHAAEGAKQVRSDSERYG
ncbi:hypothetical protein R5W23_001875, partial [Gemmata sp. JC673]